MGHIRTLRCVNWLVPEPAEGLRHAGCLSDHAPSKQLPFLQFETDTTESSNRSSRLSLRVWASRSKQEEQPRYQRGRRENSPDDRTRRCLLNAIHSGVQSGDQVFNIF